MVADFNMPKDIAEYLEDVSIGTVGTDIFVAQMPDLPANCIALYQYTGEVPPLTWAGERPSLQVRVRNSVWKTGMLNAQKVQEKLHKLTYNTSMESGQIYYYIEALGSVMQMGRDKKGQYHFSQNFRVTKGTYASPA